MFLMELAIGISEYHHRVAIAVETVLSLNGSHISLAGQFNAGECVDQKQQARPRQMKVRDESVYSLERVGRVNEQIGFARPGTNRAGSGHRFQYAHRSR